ncbi:MAG: hypothetical protein E6R03_14315 [Hyphomicrobiaceae bacterium]|nr:MAG: hypothetical protein E6R03_14315 [Hyphomicrobiaceae bacterium]
MMSRTTHELRLAELARRLAESNPDAAQVLAQYLAREAAEQKRWRGCGIVIRPNGVTGRVELIQGE